jgi:hypothetical protein
MGARRLGERDEARFLSSRHAVEGADGAVGNIKRSITSAEAALRDGTKKVEAAVDALLALDERINEAHDYLDKTKNSWKEQRRGVILALHAARDHAQQVSGRVIEDEEQF